MKRRADFIGKRAFGRESHWQGSLTASQSETQMKTVADCIGRRAFGREAVGKRA